MHRVEEEGLFGDVAGDTSSLDYSTHSAWRSERAVLPSTGAGVLGVEGYHGLPAALTLNTI